MKVEVNVSQVCRMCVCVWWRLSALLSYEAWRAQVIALHVKRAEMCVCVHVCK